MTKQLTILALVGLWGVMACTKELPPETDETQPSVAGVQTKAYGDKSPVMTVVVETNQTAPTEALNYTFSNGDYFF